MDAIRASYLLIDREKREHNFEIFGLDFMIDDHHNPWLIEINTNPCLELSCPLLSKLIPEMVQNAFMYPITYVESTSTPYFLPPSHWLTKLSSLKITPVNKINST